MTVRIVTDSTSDLPLEVAQELGVSIVPLSVIFGDEVLKEGVDISHDAFYERLVTSKVLPTTSAPSVGDFLEVYEPLLKESDEIVSIHISSKLSATYQNACNAAEQVSKKGKRVTVVDSQLVSLGMMFLVKAAASSAASGATVEQIKTAAESAIPRVHILIALDTLEYVRRGGRIGRARAFLGGILKVKPLLSIHDGEVHPEERVRTKALALERIFQMATSYPRIAEIGVAYSTNLDEADAMLSRFEGALPNAGKSIARLGPVIGVHGGPGILGVGVLEGEE